MTNLEALVYITQALMRARHPDSWLMTGGAKAIIPEIVAEVWPLMQIGDDTIIADAITELNRRYTPFTYQPAGSGYAWEE